MKIRQVDHAGVVAEPGRDAPGDLPQIAIAGRSNVGKSSLINALLGRKRLASVSKSPGKTQQIHFYEVNQRFYLVDLPGYGFADVPAEVRQKWGPLIESYLAGNPRLLGVVLLIDCRHGPSDDDAQMVDYLARLEVPALYALTKIDKLNRSERREAVEGALEALDAPEEQLVVTSALTGEGKKTLLASLGALLDETASAGGRGRGRSGSDAVRPGG